MKRRGKEGLSNSDPNLLESEALGLKSDCFLEEHIG